MSELPDGWRVESLGDLVEVLDSQRVPINRAERAARCGDVPYYGATGQVGWIDDFLFDEELVLLGEDGAPFLDANKPKAYLIRGKAWVNNHAHVLRAKKDFLLTKYLLHTLNMADYRPHITGTTRMKLNQAAMRRIPVSVPSLSEQARIVSMIDELFSDIDAGNVALADARRDAVACRQATLNALVLGSLENPEYARTIKDGKPVLPEGWRWTTLGEIAEMVQYGTGDKAQVERTNFPVLRMGNVRDGRLVLDDMKYMPPSWTDLEKYRLQHGDILFNRTNSPELVGKAAVFSDELEDAVFASYLIRVRADLAQVLPRFVVYCVNSAFGRAYIASVVSQQVGQANVNGTKLKAFPIPLPPLEEQSRLVLQADEMLSRLEALQSDIITAERKSERLRQSVLASAFSGQLV